jgi:hypothetical protein
MPKSTRSAPPKRLSIGLDSPFARRSSQRPRKAPKRVAFDINLGAIGGGGDGGKGGVNGGDEGGGESSAPRDFAPSAFSAPKETAAARNARKVQVLFVLAKRSFFAIVRSRLADSVSFARRRNDVLVSMMLRRNDKLVNTRL